MVITKTKIGIAALVLASFVVGGFALNAYQVGAFGGGGGGHMFGFFRGGCDLSGLEKDSPEWQAKMDECKAEREAKMEERKTEMGVWKDITSEERQAKMEEFKANSPENGEWKGRGSRAGVEHLFGFRGFKGFGDEANYEVVNLNNGIQITITSDNLDIVQKLQDAASRMNGALSE